METAVTHATERLDHLGIVAGVCREIGLAEFLDEQAKGSRQRVTIGTDVAAGALIDPHAHNADQVQRAVGVPVSASVETVPYDLSRRCFYRRDTGTDWRRRPRYPTSRNCLPRSAGASRRDPYRLLEGRSALGPPRQPSDQAGHLARRSLVKGLGNVGPPSGERI